MNLEQQIITLLPSKLILSAIVVITSFALISLTILYFLYDLSLIYCILSLGLMVWPIYQAITVHALKTASQAIITLKTLAQGKWLLCFNSGEEMVATLSGDSIYWPSLIILNFKVKSKRYTAIIVYDVVVDNYLHNLKWLLRKRYRLI